MTRTQVCVPCRDRKRKCDKAFPTCNLCQRLRRECHYEEIKTKVKPPSHKPARLSTHLSSPNAKRNTPAIPAFHSYGVTPQPNVDISITEQLSRSVGNVTQIKEVAKEYFATIHKWLPIVTEGEYFERLPRIFVEPHADFSLLSLSMSLIISLPRGSDILSTASPLYTLLKSSVAIVEAAGIHTFGVVQSRLLIALFEVGHGIDPAAYITIGATARAAAAIGINITSNPHSPSNIKEYLKSEEALRLWWGIVTLDRFYTVVQGSGNPATQDLGRPNQLPRAEDAMLEEREPPDLSTPSSVRVGPFARQAQVSHLLDRLLIHLRNPTSNETFNMDESKILTRALESFRRLIPEECAEPWPLYCGAIGLCYSALMALQESTPKQEHQDNSSSTLSAENSYQSAIHNASNESSLKTTVNNVVYISKKFNEGLDSASFTGLSPFVPYSIYRAIVVLRRLYKQMPDNEFWQGLSSLETMLTHFSKRWAVAGKYLKLLNRLPDSNAMS